MLSELIDTTAALITFLDGLGDCKGQPPSLYVDLEGNNLSRHGTLSLITILVEPRQKVYFVDVTTLKEKAFDTMGSDKGTIRSILESKDIPKVFFDIRNDSDALFGLHGVRVVGIEDLQLMELASRNFSKRCVNGLAKCIERDSTVGYAEKRDWQRVKDKGRILFDPARGGSYAVFDQRPMDQEVIDYCAQDVALMPHLRDVYCSKLCDAWWREIISQTETRVEQSQKPGYNGQGRHMAMAPERWLRWHPTTAERGIRTLYEISGPRKDLDVAKLSSPEDRPTSIVLPARRFQDLAAVLERLSMHDVRGVSCLDSDEADDFAACDSECGYCGQCPY
ncbi:hypothetical protein LTR56_026312 [Elasticomyces elasticus]|nr:hypothetical protein LTR56_026312 [Elasticomyces elasticus]